MMLKLCYVWDIRKTISDYLSNFFLLLHPVCFPGLKVNSYTKECVHNHLKEYTNKYQNTCTFNSKHVSMEWIAMKQSTHRFNYEASTSRSATPCPTLWWGRISASKSFASSSPVHSVCHFIPSFDCWLNF